MSERKKMTLVEKEKKLLEKLEKAKKDLIELKKRRIKECGEIVVKHGLDQYDNAILDKAFVKLAKELNNESS